MKIQADLSHDRVKNYVNLGGIIVPLLLVLYGILVQTGQATLPYPIPLYLYWVLALSWIPLGIVQIAIPPKGTLDTFLRLLGYHLLATSLLFFIVGVDSPYATFWILLLLAAYSYFGRVGIIANMIWFTVLALSDFAYDYILEGELNIGYLVVLAAIFNIGLVVLSIAEQQKKRASELIASKVREGLQRDSVHVIINNLTTAVISTDIEGRVHFFNAASASLFNTNVSMTGKTVDKIAKLKTPEGKAYNLLRHMRSADKITIVDDLRINYSPDDEIRVEVTILPIRSSYTRSSGSDAHIGYILMARDVTKSKTLEEEKDEFISVVSHELRTPVATAEGAVSNLQLMLNHPDVDIAMKKDAAEQAHNEIVFLSKMINDLSTLSRAERGAFSEPELIDIQDLCSSLLNEFMDEANKKKLHLNLDIGPKLGSVFTSRLYLEELLQNFISNAIKYTLKGSVTISVHKQRDKVTFSVTDTGVGMSKSEQEKIFTKFYRIEDYRTRETTGTGLGLYLAKKLADKIGSEIKLKSRLNHGSSFSITLPSAKTD